MSTPGRAPQRQQEVGVDIKELGGGDTQGVRARLTRVGSGLSGSELSLKKALFLPVGATIHLNGMRVLHLLRRQTPAIRGTRILDGLRASRGRHSCHLSRQISRPAPVLRLGPATLPQTRENGASRRAQAVVRSTLSSAGVPERVTLPRAGGAGIPLRAEQRPAGGRGGRS